MGVTWESHGSPGFLAMYMRNKHLAGVEGINGLRSRDYHVMSTESQEPITLWAPESMELNFTSSQ